MADSIQNPPIDNTPPITTPPIQPQADELAEFKGSDGSFDADKIKKLYETNKFNRQTLSKIRQMPAKVEEYAENYKLDSKYTEFLNNEENKKKVDEVFSKLDRVSLEKGIGVDRNHDIRDFMLETLTENGVLETKSEAQRQAEKAEKVGERNKALQEHLGDTTDIPSWIDGLKDWLKNGFCNNDAEYALHTALIETNASWALSLNKMRQGLMGNKIPVIQGDSSFNQAEWDRAFSKANPDEQEKMLTDRAKHLTKHMK